MSGERRRFWGTRVVAIIAVAWLVSFALYMGHNGLLLSLGIAAITGIAGYDIGVQRGKQKMRELGGGGG